MKPWVWWKHSPLEILGIIFGCITIAMMLVTVAYASPKIDATPLQKTFVFKHTATGWHWHIGKVPAFGDATVIACFATPEDAKVLQCFVTSEGSDEAEVIELRLHGEAAT